MALARLLQRKEYDLLDPRFLVVLQFARSTQAVKNSHIFDILILFNIKEFLDVPLSIEEFIITLEEYRISASKKHAMDYDSELKTGLIHQKLHRNAIITFSSNGNVRCLNYLLSTYPLKHPINMEDSGLLEAIDNAIDKQHIFVVSRLVRLANDPKDKTILVNHIFMHTLKMQNFWVFKWLIMHHKSSLKESAPACEGEAPECKSPPPEMLIRLHTMRRYPDEDQNPFLAFFQNKLEWLAVLEKNEKVLEAKHLEVTDAPPKESKDAVAGLDDLDNASLGASEGGAAIQTGSQMAQLGTQTSYTLYFELALGVAALVGGCAVLALLDTPTGLGVGLGLCVSGLGIFGHCYYNNRKAKASLDSPPSTYTSRP